MYVNGLAPNSVRAYRADLNGLLAETGNLTLAALEEAAARYLTQHRTEWAPKTTERKLGTFRVFGKWAGHPTFLAAYKAPTPGKSIPHPLPEGIAGVRAMLDAANGDRRYGALVALTGLCGLRVSEAIAICPCHIDPGERLLTVRGKGDKTRTVPISDRAWAAIEPAMISSVGFYDSGPLVRLKDRQARQALTTLGRKAGISRRVASHDMRATLGTAAFNLSGNLRAVQELLGHASSQTTEIYTGVEMKSLRKAVDL